MKCYCSIAIMISVLSTLAMYPQTMEEIRFVKARSAHYSLELQPIHQDQLKGDRRHSYQLLIRHIVDDRVVFTQEMPEGFLAPLFYDVARSYLIEYPGNTEDTLIYAFSFSDQMHFDELLSRGELSIVKVTKKPDFITRTCVKFPYSIGPITFYSNYIAWTCQRYEGDFDYGAKDDEGWIGAEVINISKLCQVGVGIKMHSSVLAFYRKLMAIPHYDWPVELGRFRGQLVGELRAIAQKIQESNLPECTLYTEQKEASP